MGRLLLDVELEVAFNIVEDATKTHCLRYAAGVNLGWQFHQFLIIIIKLYSLHLPLWSCEVTAMMLMSVCCYYSTHWTDLPRLTFSHDDTIEVSQGSLTGTAQAACWVSRHWSPRVLCVRWFVVQYMTTTPQETSKDIYRYGCSLKTYQANVLWRHISLLS